MNGRRYAFVLTAAAALTPLLAKAKQSRTSIPHLRLFDRDGNRIDENCADRQRELIKANPPVIVL